MNCRILSALLFLVLCAMPPRAAAGGRSAIASEDRLVTLLLNAPAPIKYGMEGYGAGLGLLDQSYEDGRWKFAHALAGKIIEFGSSLVPICIDHLNDTRLTHATYLTTTVPQRAMPVPLGFLCQDILIAVVKDSPRINVPDCADDGPGACIRKGFFFRPDSYHVVGNIAHALPIVKKVKSNWERAYRAGIVVYGWKPATG
jgi:hypothetical protein